MRGGLDCDHAQRRARGGTPATRRTLEVVAAFRAHYLTACSLRREHLHTSRVRHRTESSRPQRRATRSSSPPASRVGLTRQECSATYSPYLFHLLLPLALPGPKRVALGDAVSFHQPLPVEIAAAVRHPPFAGDLTAVDGDCFSDCVNRQWSGAQISACIYSLKLFLN